MSRYGKKRVHRPPPITQIIDGMLPHPSITLDRIATVIETACKDLEDPGICLNCGEETGGTEPDACRDRCPACGQTRVYGAEVLLEMLS
jgi:hypothetical protein